MIKEITEHAHAAKLIRAELKNRGIKAKVTSTSFTGGNSVRVLIESSPPWIVKEIKTFCRQFEYGSFDGMRDIYEYNNTRDDLPQVKYLFVDVDFTYADRQNAWDYLRKHFAGYEGAPINHVEARAFWANGYCASQEIWHVLNGEMDERTEESTQFWNK